jgi:hypothetical protein
MCSSSAKGSFVAAWALVLMTAVGCDGRPLAPAGAAHPTSGAGGAAPGAADAGTAQDAGRRPDDAARSDAAPPDLRPDLPPQGIDAGLDAGAAPDATGPKPRTLSLVLSGAPWYATQATQGIAVDTHGRVYVGDNATIYMIDGTALSKYLTADEAATPDQSNAGFGDFDIDPDDRLYIVMGASSASTGEFTSVVRSSMAHQAEPWVRFDKIDQADKVAVISDDLLAVVSRYGLWTFTAAGGQMVYSPTSVMWASSCAAEDLAAAPSGVFLYQPGCNAYPLLRGNANGSGVGVLYATSVLQPSSVIPADNFLCSGRDPSGGFYVVVSVYSDGSDVPRLYHVAEDAQAANGLVWIQTVPTFGDAKKSQGEVFGFDFCSVAAARDGTVFVQTYHQLWKVSP